MCTCLSMTTIAHTLQTHKNQSNGDEGGDGGGDSSSDHEQDSDPECSEEATDEDITKEKAELQRRITDQSHTHSLYKMYPHEPVKHTLNTHALANMYIHTHTHIRYTQTHTS